MAHVTRDDNFNFVWKTIASGEDGPGPRSRHGFVYDRAARAAVLFGGAVWEGNGFLCDDTWELHGDRWLHIKLREAPPARHRGAMVYDGVRGFSVLFGGQGSRNEMLADTWTYADRRWRHARQSWFRRPSPRGGHAMAFDEDAGVTVLFGGIDRYDRPLGDTWIFDGSVWRQESGASPRPRPRRYAAFAYSSKHGGCILHGGSEDDNGRVGFGDTWLFRDRLWTRLSSGFDTSVRDDHGLAYHHAARCLVMLEGLSRERGVLVDGDQGWEQADISPLHPRHQCAPLAWDDDLHSVVFHGGETSAFGSQLDSTWVLQLSTSALRAGYGR